MIFPVVFVVYGIWMTVFLVQTTTDRIKNDDIKKAMEVAEIDYNIAVRNELAKNINDFLSDKYGNWSVYVKNLDTGMDLEINNQRVTAASLIKLFNMVALYCEVNTGNVELTENLRGQLKQMITVSSNSASNTVVEAIGKGSFETGAVKVTERMEEMGCTDTIEQYKLFDVANGYATGRNTTSVRDCGLILEKIYNKDCIEKDFDIEMLDLLKQQTRDWKLPQGLPEGIEIAHKTGENSKIEADAGIVFSPACDYIICVSVTEYGAVKPRSEIGQLSKCVYDFFNTPQL